MRITIRVLLCVYVLLSWGCSTVERRVPDGRYCEPATANFIEVSGPQVRVHIESQDERDTDATGLLFKYALWSDGSLWLVVSRSGELMRGYPALAFHWDGKRIIARDAKSGLSWEFDK